MLAREGAFVGVDARTLPPLARPAAGRRNLLARRNVSGLSALSGAIDRLGPSYVKLGQFLAPVPTSWEPRSRRSWSGCKTA